MSAALDTNGQNARFVQAARRWGDHPDVLKAFAVGRTDPAGVVGRFADAAERHPVGLTIRSAHKASAYFEFPVDIVWDRKTDREVRTLAREADVLHLNNSLRPYQMLGGRKPALLHHHGSLFRSNPAYMLRNAKTMQLVQAVSTMDLTRPAPRLLHWLPTAYDIDKLKSYRKRFRRKPDGLVRIVSCPTNRDLKSTNLLEAVVADLKAEGLPVELVLVEKMRWDECMRVKATADVLFDQTLYGYGCNAVEAWGMGIPVIAGADEWTLDRMRSEWGGLPFYEASDATLRQAIQAMVQSADLRAEWAALGLAHFNRYHAELPALAKLAELYDVTIKTKEVRALLAAPVTFANPQNRSVLVDNVKVRWGPGQMLTTKDPRTIMRLRRIASSRPLWGIVEIPA